MNNLFKIGCLLTLLSSLSCQPITTPDSTVESSYTIASFLPISGALSSKGPSRQNAAILAVQHINQAGKIDGKELELLTIDTETNGQTSREKLKKVYDKYPSLKAIIGASSSEVSKALLEEAKKSKTVMISPSSTSSIFTTLDDQSLFFRTAPGDEFQGKIMADKILESGLSRLAILHIDNAYGNSLKDILKKDFETVGGRVITQVSYGESPQSSYQNELNQLLKEPVDVVAFIGYPAEATTIFNEWLDSELAPNVQWFLSDGLKDIQLLKSLKQPDKLNGALGTIPANPNSDSAQLFQDEYIQQFGDFPVSFAAHTYDAVILSALALQQQSISTQDLPNALLEVSRPPGETIGPGVTELKKALQLLKEKKAINYEGASGAVDFDSHGNVKSDYEIWTIKNRFIVRVESRSIQ